MPKGGKAKHERSIIYVKAASLADICRFAFNADFTSRSLIFFKGRLMAIGEQIGNTLVAYYVHADKKENCVRYKFSSSAKEPEIAEFADAIDEGKSGMNIIEVNLGYIKEAKDVEKDQIEQISIPSPGDLMNAAVKKAVREESFMSLYSFVYNNKRYIAGFELLDELSNEKKTFYYSMLKNNSTAGYAKYKYSDNTFEFTETVEEHSYIYVKIINLAEPFQFFKPD